MNSAFTVLAAGLARMHLASVPTKADADAPEGQAGRAPRRTQMPSAVFERTKAFVEQLAELGFDLRQLEPLFVRWLPDAEVAERGPRRCGGVRPLLHPQRCPLCRRPSLLRPPLHFVLASSWRAEIDVAHAGPAAERGQAQCLWQPKAYWLAVLVDRQFGHQGEQLSSKATDEQRTSVPKPGSKSVQDGKHGENMQGVRQQ